MSETKSYYVNIQFGTEEVTLEMEFNPFKSMGPALAPNLMGGDHFGAVQLPGKVIAVHCARRGVFGVDIVKLAEALHVPLVRPPVNRNPPKPKPEPYEQETF